MFEDNIRNRGNVLFLILIAVALFAALTYAISQSTRSGGGDAEEEKSGVLAAQVINDAIALRSAYQRLRLNCDLVEIDMDEDTNDSYRRNPLSPSASGDFSCALFHPDGGGQRNDRLPPKIFSGNITPIGWQHFSSLLVYGVGLDTNYELGLVMLDGIRDNICLDINESLIQKRIIPALTGNFDVKTYDGTFPTGGWDNLNTSDTYGQPMLCIEATHPSYPAIRENVFYVILEER